MRLAKVLPFLLSPSGLLGCLSGEVLNFLKSLVHVVPSNDGLVNH